MQKVIIYILSTIFIFTYSNAQTDKDKLFDRIKSDYSDLKSLSLNFVLNENPAVKGSLMAKKGNKYILTVANRKIYCDGKTIWNYVPENKNVLVSNFESHGESASIEKIFFKFTNNFTPVKLYKNQTGRRGSSRVLELKPTEDNDDDITLIKLIINPDNLDIYSITIVRNYAEESWEISNLKLNPNIADNKFMFVAPENVELIDLR